MARWTKKSAFESYGTECANDRWSWSARSPDGSVVALTFWTDRFVDWKARPIVYSDVGWGQEPERVDRQGNKERRENIRHALAHLGGVVSVVMARAVDTAEHPRQSEEFWPRPNLRMRITFFDEETGEWQAESVGESM